MKKALVFLILTITLLLCLTACKHEHSFGEWYVTKNAACTEDGIIIRYCDCGEKQRDAIPATGHAQDIIPAKEATCSVTGLTEGKKCANCNEILVAQHETPAISHSYDDAYDAECNACGFVRQINCKHDNPEKIVVVDSKSPTCQETGLTEGMKCLNCDAMVVPQLITPVVDCIAGDWIVDIEPTKTEDGKHHTECTMCGEILKEQIIGAGSQGLVFYQNSDNTYTLNSIGSCTDTDIVIPRIYNGLSVTGIGYSVFQNSTSLTSITIPDSITSIGKYAFHNCGSLKNVYYGGNVEGWLNITFSYYYSNPIWYGANLYFNDELVTEIEIPNTVTSVGYIAFHNCTSLTSVKIPDSVTNIGDYAFYGCNSLSNITIGNSVESIGMSAFYNCSSLTSIILPNSLISLDQSVFSECTSLADITIGTSLKSVGANVFYNCPSLTSINFEGTIDQWNAIAKGDYWDTNTGNYTIYCTDGEIAKDGTVTYYPSEGLELTLSGGRYKVSGIGSCYDTDIVIPSSYNGIPVTSIEDNAFKDCVSITSVRIFDSVTSIGFNAFFGCTSLTSVVISDSVTSIEDQAFCYCTSLTNVVISDSVTSIGSSAFANCTSLEKIIIPCFVYTIGSYAFAGCESLTIYCERENRNHQYLYYWNGGRTVVWEYKGE